jgi:hypothetical protein
MTLMSLFLNSAPSGTLLIIYIDGQKQIGGKNKLHYPQCLFFAVKFFQGFFYQLHVTQIYKCNCAHCTYIGILG